MNHMILLSETQVDNLKEALDIIDRKIENDDGDNTNVANMINNFNTQ
jgi:hypothetical protein